MTEADTTEVIETGLTPLDWVVIVAATVAFVLLAVWVYQGRHYHPPTPPPASN